ncbi:MAG: oxygen-independent coproporphyrinogen III oxidase, partial [Pseudomonadota bacterium]
MKLARREGPIAAYARTLIREIALIADRLPARMSVSHIHWGGGTPTALAPADLALVMAAVRGRFDLADGAEIAIEGDPRTLTEPMAERIGALGFTRASFGVQEFDPKVQIAINRIQPPAMVAEAVERLRKAGVAGVNFDLIYGLPHQTERALRETIRLAAEMRPDRIALFGYAHVPWMAKKQRLIDEAALPGAAARMGQAAAAASALKAAGYLQIGLDHFALPEDGLARAAAEGSLRRNFQGYTTDAAETLIGFGATSIGRSRFGYVQNIVETRAWTRAVEAGEPPIGKGLALTEADRLRAFVIDALMCAGKADLSAAAARFDAPTRWWADAEPELEAFEADGLIRRDGSCVSLTPAGEPLRRVVASAFDAYLPKRAARHSVAV